MLERRTAGFIVRTERGRIAAGDVIVATNGYSGRATGRVGRQLAPIPSFIIATERLGANLVRSLIPGMRMIVESRAAHCYYRPSPDGDRILFGARAALTMVRPEQSARRNLRYLQGLFPSLQDVRVTHSWSGWIAFTRSLLPAIGRRDGVHYAMGYNGSGVAMAPYLGSRIAVQVLGQPEGRTAFDHLPFRTWPLHASLPLARPLVGAWHRLRDWREGS
jgi:gamma-glutamylputrescine oxidase